MEDVSFSTVMKCIWEKSRFLMNHEEWIPFLKQLQTVFLLAIRLQHEKHHVIMSHGNIITATATHLLSSQLHRNVG